VRDRYGRTAASLLLLPAALIGCGTSPPEVPPVPAIDDARDASAADPCALVTTGQLAAAGLGGSGAPEAAEEGPRCRWRGSGGELAVTIYTGGDGLATLARNSEPTTTRVRLAGYPALETFTGGGEFCQYDVGVAERQVVMAALDAPGANSCAVLQTVLPGMIERLPQGGTR
jgi:hypothetical protein